MEIKQVVTETDWMHAIYEYLMEQLGGRFKLQFPEHIDYIDGLLESMQDPLIRSTELTMMEALMNVTAAHGGMVTRHSLNGCPHDMNHKFSREFINLVWDARRETSEWLQGQGVIPGQSCN